MFKMEGKVAVVTGGNSGIGLSIARSLARQNVKVAMVARRRKKLEEAKALLESEGGEAEIFTADITSEDDVRQMAEDVYRRFGRVDILINNAGLGIFKNVEELESREWKNVIDVILTGTFYCTRYLLPYIYENKSGHVINITSLWAKENCATCSAYTAAKHGQKGFTESVREEARKHNVKVTNIMPGTVDSPFFSKVKWNHDFSRALQPEDVAKLVIDVLQFPERAVVEDVVLQAIHPA